MSDIFKSWRLVDRFSARELAALLIDLLPESAADDALVPVLRRVAKDYGMAVWEHSEIINPMDNWVAVEHVSETSLQSNAMLSLGDRNNPNHEYDSHRFYDWLGGNQEMLEGWKPEWLSSKLEYQWFSKAEVIRWLRASNIPSEFFLGATGENTGSDPLKESERDKLLRQIGALSLLLANKSNTFKVGDKPNGTQISEAVSELMGAMGDVNISAVAGSPLRESIKNGIARLTAIQR